MCRTGPWMYTVVLTVRPCWFNTRKKAETWVFFLAFRNNNRYIEMEKISAEVHFQFNMTPGDVDYKGQNCRLSHQNKLSLTSRHSDRVIFTLMFCWLWHYALILGGPTDPKAACVKDDNNNFRINLSYFFPIIFTPYKTQYIHGKVFKR